MYRHMHLYYDSLVMVIIYHRVHFRAMEMLVMDVVLVICEPMSTDASFVSTLFSV